jgi:hypothetical protein
MRLRPFDFLPDFRSYVEYFTVLVVLVSRRFAMYKTQTMSWTVICVLCIGRFALQRRTFCINHGTYYRFVMISACLNHV